MYPHAPPPPIPGKKSRRNLWIVLGVIGGVVVVGLIVIIAFVVFFFSTITAPADAVNDYLAALQKGDYETGYSYLCSSQQSTITESEFEAAIEAEISDVGKIESYNANHVNVTGSAATVSYDLKTSARSSPVRVTTGLVDEDGWKVCSFDEPEPDTEF